MVFPEVVGMVQQVALQPEEITSKGLEFHVCTINERVHTKNSGNYDPHSYSIKETIIWSHAVNTDSS